MSRHRLGPHPGVVDKGTVAALWFRRALAWGVAVVVLGAVVAPTLGLTIYSPSHVVSSVFNDARASMHPSPQRLLMDPQPAPVGIDLFPSPDLIVSTVLWSMALITLFCEVAAWWFMLDSSFGTRYRFVATDSDGESE